MKNGMIGAIVGDIAGSRFEWHNRKTKRFTLLRAKGYWNVSFVETNALIF